MLHLLVDLVLPPHRALHLERLLLLRAILELACIERAMPAAAAAAVAALQLGHRRREGEALHRHHRVCDHRPRAAVTTIAVDVQHVPGAQLPLQLDNERVEALVLQHAVWQQRL